MAPHSSTLAWKTSWMEEPGRLQSMGSLRVGHDWVTSLSLSRIGEGNGNPLQCSCLENPRDRGAWWADIYGVSQSRTWLKWPSSRLVITFLPRSKRLLISWLQSPSAVNFQPKIITSKKYLYSNIYTGISPKSGYHSLVKLMHKIDHHSGL